MIGYSRLLLVAVPVSGMPEMPRGFRVAPMSAAELEKHSIDISPAVQRLRFAQGMTCLAAFNRKDELVGWARKFSLFPYPFVTACCAMEFMAVSASAYDTDRFGAALPRFSPRQADLLMVVGTVTQKQAPILLKVYEQMCEPKWVVAFGVCTCTGGFYDNYATVQGIDTIIPVDIYVPGCPPRPEQLIYSLMLLPPEKILLSARA